MPQGDIDYIADCKILPGLQTDHSFVLLKIVLDKTLRGPGLWKLNSKLLEDLIYLEEIKKCIATSRLQTKQVDPSIRWEIVKNNIVNLSKDYAKYKAA